MRFGVVVIVVSLVIVPLRLMYCLFVIFETWVCVVEMVVVTFSNCCDFCSLPSVVVFA